MYVQKTKTWDDNWNDMIRYEFFPDEKLKQLMMIPDGTDILQFTNRYFMRDDGSTDELLTNEKVRVMFYDDQGNEFGSRHVFARTKNFSIFVKTEYEHNATNDRLKSRQNLIAERIKYLMLRKRHQHGLSFQMGDEYDMWSKTIRYKLYHIDFFYITTT